MKILGILVLNILIPFVLNAQMINTISGKVVNGKNEMLVGNVVILSSTDSSFLKGTSFLEAPFELTGINQKEVLLKFTSLQFPDSIIRVTYNGQENINLGTIVISATKHQLNEVRVTGQTPLVQYSANGTIEVNVAKTILSTSSSVTEILARSPNVVVSDEGISVFGKGEAIIYLNGKLISSQQLSSIPVSQIAKVEIISNPSSIYDAAGKAVINIKTKENTDEGMLGSVSQQVSYSDFSGTDTQTLLDLSYRKGKMALVGSYNLRLGKDREVLHTTRNRLNDDDFLNSDLTTEWKRKFKNYSSYSLGMQYDINKKSNVSLEYNGYLEDLGGSQDSRNTILTKAEDGFYTSDIGVAHKTINHSLRLNYNRKTDTLGSTLFVGSQYSYYDADVNDMIDESSVVNDVDTFRWLNNKIGHKIIISSTQLDYTKVLNARHQLSMGAKFAYVSTKSNTRFFIGADKHNLILDEELSNNFEYEEKIPAAYLNYNGKLSGKTNLEVGVRSEWTNYSLNTSVQGGRYFSDSYLNFFPNLGINSRLNNHTRIRAAYAARITRPRYQNLNPFAIYQDPFTTIEGNPNLIPEKSHAFEVGATYKILDFTAGYTYTIDPLDASAVRGDDEKSYVLKPLNLDKSHSYVATLSTTFSKKWWTTNTSLSVRYVKLIDNKYDFTFTGSKPQLYLYTNNTFNVNNLFKIQLLAWYMGARYNGIFFRQDYSTVTMGIEKELFNKSVLVKFVANDIFNRYKLAGDYSIGETDVIYRRDYGMDYFRFIVSYNFGKLKKSNYKSKSTGQSESNRAL